MHPIAQPCRVEYNLRLIALPKAKGVLTQCGDVAIEPITQRTRLSLEGLTIRTYRNEQQEKRGVGFEEKLFHLP
jgi:hypothetical protein